MSSFDPRAPRTQGIQKSTSSPDALAKAIAAASPVARSIAERAAGGNDGGHDHDGTAGGHSHDHVESRLTDHEGRLANLEGKGGDGWSGGN